MGRSPKTEGASGRIANSKDRDGTSPEVWRTCGRYQPKGKPSAYRPQAPSVTCGDSSLPEGAITSLPRLVSLL